MTIRSLARHGRWLAAAALFWAWMAAGTGAIEKLAGFHAARESISAADLQRHVDFLADDAREGREAGTRGGHAAGDYLAAQLAALHLPGAGSSQGYFQPFAPNFRNVLALLEGSDPGLKNQVVVVGAHYDHVGYGSQGSAMGEVGMIHHGADDNASGTAGVLELAGALARLPQPPRRSILFAFFDAEEKGALGSHHWVAHPTLPLERVVMMVNLDMIGRLRGDRLMLFGSNSGYGLRRLVSSHNEPPLWIDFRRTVVPEADHTAFFARNVPVLVLHTDLHPQYHRPGDTAGLINAAGMRQVVRLLFGVVYDVANRDEPPRFREASRGETHPPPPVAAPMLPEGGRPLRVGVTWRVDDAEPGAAILTHVVPGSPADRAGLKAEDRIYQAGGRDFPDDTELGNLLKTLPGPIRLTVERNGQLGTVEIQFTATSQRRAA